MQGKIFGIDSIIVIGAAAGLLLIFLILAVAFAVKASKARKSDEQNKAISIECLSAIVNTIDEKDPFSKGHSYRVAKYSVEIARRMDLANLDKIYIIALLHDIGKIGIPDDVLKRVGRLMPEEYALMKQHTEFGRMILSQVTSVPGITEGAKYHHEHYDGSGYNEGLRGENIPLIGRIIGVADAYDAMTSPRSYRRGLSKAEAINELNRCAGTQFDPNVARIMVRMLNDGFNVEQ
ncbi:MAG: HD-GYP domain-containing protein [Ruminococcaceae bacterium]|nr:HD-GYP domain-containing protein [Oscillospiraceae bacterium]